MPRSSTSNPWHGWHVPEAPASARLAQRAQADLGIAKLAAIISWRRETAGRPSSSRGENSRLRGQRPAPSLVLCLDNPGRAPTEEEANMAIAMLVDNPEGSQKDYDSVREQLGLEKPAGGIFHVAGPSPNGGWRVIEVWESEEEANRFFQERFFPALQAVGVPGPPPKPELWPVHNAMT